MDYKQITIKFLKQELKIQNNHFKKFTKKEWRKIITIKITSLKQVLELLEGKDG